MTKELVAANRNDVIGKETILPGFLIVLRQGTCCLVTLLHHKGMMKKFLVSKSGVFYAFENYNEKLLHESNYNPLDIMQVWGLQKYDERIFDKNFNETFSTERRKLIWEEKGYSIAKLVEMCENGEFDNVPFDKE